MGARGETVRNASSQASYKETPYQDQSWEVVGEIIEEKEFTPMSIQVVPREALMTDPMFADYGGVPPGKETVTRWHLPERLAYSAKTEQEKKAEKGPEKLHLSAQELEAIKTQAYQQGLADGRVEGDDKGKQKLQQLQQSIQGIINDLATQVTENLRGIERNAVDLAVAISDKIIGYAVEINPEYISKLVSEALNHVGSSTIKKVRVSPQDLEFIELVGIPKQLVERGDSWTFEKDESIRSGCIVETSAGEIDYRLDEAWERMKDSIVKVLR
jgi:flagellar assembly protein FliH